MIDREESLHLLVHEIDYDFALWILHDFADRGKRSMGKSKWVDKCERRRDSLLLLSQKFEYSRHMVVKNAMNEFELDFAGERRLDIVKNFLQMLKAQRISFYKDAYELCCDLIRMIAGRFRHDERRAVLALAVLTRTGKSVDVENPSAPLSHDRKPRFGVTPKDFVLLSSVWL